MLRSVINRMGAGALAGVLLLSAVSASAQEKEKVVIKKRTLIDFSDVNIEGELRKPDGMYFGSRKKTRFKEMIQVRPHFNPEINASMDQL